MHVGSVRRWAAVSLCAVAVLAAGAGRAAAAPVSARSLPVAMARISHAPTLGGVVQLADGAFAGPKLGALVGQTCPTTTGAGCRGFVARTADGGATWTEEVLGGETASSVAVSPDGRVWVWLEGAGCVTDRACRWRLVTAAPGSRRFRTSITTAETPTGIVAQGRGWALTALDDCPPGPAGQCSGTLSLTRNAGATWRPVWHGSDWVGGLASGGGRVWATSVRGVGK